MRQVRIAGKERALHSWRPGIRDPRDVAFQFAPRRFASWRTPVVYDPRKTEARDIPSRIEDQGQLGSCTGETGTTAVEYLTRRQARLADRGVDLDDERKFPELSPLGLYYLERELEGTTGMDVGATILSICKALMRWGVMTERLWPYRPERFDVPPDSAAMADAETRKIKSHHAIVGGVDGVIQAVAQYKVVLCGFAVPPTIDRPEVAETGVIPEMGDRGPIGGHAVPIMGWDRRRRLFLAQNSWGEGFGEWGWIWLPFSYARDPGLMECRAIVV